MKIRFSGYRGIRFMRGEKDEIIGALKTALRDDEHLNNNQIAEMTGVSSTTIANWFDGDTRKPQNATVMAVTGPVGLLRRDYRNKDGTVSPGFFKDREYDYNEERQKQADWLLKQGRPKRKRGKKKKNGSAPARG